jgi:hypothetical protein
MVDPEGFNVGPVPAEDVTFLEQFLAAAGFLKTPYTLKGALEEWQKSVGLDATGVLDDATRNKIGDTLKYVSSQPQETPTADAAARAAGGATEAGAAGTGVAGGGAGRSATRHARPGR